MRFSSVFIILLDEPAGLAPHSNVYFRIREHPFSMYARRGEGGWPKAYAVL